MQLFSYLYIVAGHIHSQQIKVMELKAYLQLQKSEILSLYPTDSLSSIEIQNLLGTNTIIAGTGTTGDTMTLTSGIRTFTGIDMDIGTIGIGIIALIVILLAHMLDRRLNKNLDRELHQEYCPNQTNQESE